MVSRFEEYDTAARMQKIIENTARGEIERMRPEGRIATVTAVQRIARNCTIIFAGESSPVSIPTVDWLQPNVGDNVLVEKLKGEYYVSRILGSPGFLYEQFVRQLCQTFQGGGDWRYSSGSVLWNARIIGTSMGFNEFQQGVVTIPVPVAGVAVPVYNTSGSTSVTTVAGGVPLLGGQTLYYALSPRNTNLMTGGDTTAFRIVGFSDYGNTNNKFEIPWNWIPIVSCLVDGGYSPQFRTITGQVFDTVKAFPYAANWTSYTPDVQWELPSYRKMSDGFIQLQGLIYTTVARAAGVTIGTFPAGYRPLKTHGFWVETNGPAGAAVSQRVEITAAGVLRTGNFTMVANTFIFLDQISWMAEQ